ncbi:MAG TPA: hypothetical protein VMD30_11855 [Tepidisphaeraceae bacterium]|nr:hypothetical protein [Tepidisphaeraceae bacterium]
MLISESDLDILETYLDGELPIADAEGLWRRLSNEPALTAALDDLRAQRANRLVVWQEMEPVDAEELHLRRRVASSLRRHNHLESVWRVSKVSSAAAAMILVGFAVGRMRAAAPIATSPSPGNNMVAINKQPTPGNATASVYRVGYFDPTGKLIAVQPFNSLQDANDFVNDINTWQIQQHASPDDHDSPVIPVSDDQWR